MMGVQQSETAPKRQRPNGKRLGLLLVAALAGVVLAPAGVLPMALAQPPAPEASRDAAPAGRPLVLVLHGTRPGIIEVGRGRAEDPAHPRKVTVSAATHGLVTCTAAGRCDYRPDASFRGRDGFQVTSVQDGRREMRSVVVRGDRPASVAPGRDQAAAAAPRARVGAGASGSSGAQPATGSISGVVTVPTGSASGACVHASSRTADGDANVVAGSPASSGSFTVTGLAPGSYTVSFAPCRQGINLITQYWQHTTDRRAAKPVAVTAGAVTSGINAVMKAGGSISGTVTVPTGTASDVCVEAYSNGVDGTAYGYEVWGSVTAAAGRVTSGSYLLTGLLNSSYTVSFYPCTVATNLLPQIWQQTTDGELWTTVWVTPGAVTSGIDAAMKAGGSFSGTVVVPSGSAGDVCVDASSDRWYTPVVQVMPGATATSGTYTVTGLPAGSYPVAFSSCRDNANLTTQYWQHTTDKRVATWVSVVVGATTTNVDATMTAGGSITGTVSVPAGSAGDVCVDATDATDASRGGQSTAVVAGSPVTAGRYVLTGLLAGSYTVTFRPCGEANLATQYWPHTADRGKVTPVAVRTGVTTPGIDAAMTAAGSITGTVSVPSGWVSDVCVEVNGFSRVTAVVGSRPTTGSYALTGLTTGSYTVSFGPCGSTNLAAQYWPHTADRGKATSVSVTAGAVTSGINATMSTGGSITGTVTVPSGSAGQVCVDVRTASDGYFWRTTTVVPGAPATTGTYAVTGVPPGSYTVAFNPCGQPVNLAGQYWPHTSQRKASTPVSVTAGAVTRGIDAAMTIGGSITGTVTVPAGSAGEACVSAYNTDSNGSVTVVPGSPVTSGKFTVTGLSTGSYRVSFDACGDADLASQYWPRTSNQDAATPVSVTAGRVTTGIGAAMTKTGSITGTLTVPARSVTDVCVQVEGDKAWNAVTVVTAGSPVTSGTYTITGLVTGSYTVVFSPCRGAKLSKQYWQHTTDATKAKPVSVQVGAATSGINAAMATQPTGSPA